MSAQKEMLTLEKRLQCAGYNQIPAVSALTGSITAVTKANPAAVTCTAHGLSTGQKITITAVVGMVQLNTHTFTITKVDADHFTLDGIDSSAYTTYVSGGTWVVVATGLAAGLASNAIPSGAAYAMIQAEAQSIRIREDGTAPTATVGVLIAANSSLWIRSIDLSAVQLIRTVAGGIANITFYKEPQPDAEA